MASRHGAIFSVSLVSGVALFLFAQSAVRDVLSAPCFQVREVEVIWPKELERPAERYRLAPPTSIFWVDLGLVGSALGMRYPVMEVDAVRRILPGRLVVHLRPRRVVAQLRADRYYPVSDEGTVVAQGQANPWPHLPMVSLGNLKGPFHVGDSIREPHFWRASEILAAVHASGGLAGHGVNHIKTKEGLLTLLLDSGVEIRFLADHVEQGWQRLAELLRQRPDLLEKARYLDLRFEDPVIGNLPKRRPR